MTRPDPLTGGERRLWRVRLGVALAMLLKKDLPFYYHPGPIARLQHGISQAVARHVLTHRNNPLGGWYMDTLILAVCGEGTSNMTLRNYRRRLKEDSVQLLEIGIDLNGSRIKRVTTARYCVTTARYCVTTAR